MDRKIIWKAISKWIFFGYLLTTLGACNIISAQFTGDDNEDIQAARAVKSALLASASLNAAPLSVIKRGDEIILSGYVESVIEKIEAEAIAHKLYPEASIKNDIQLR